MCTTPSYKCMCALLHLCSNAKHIDQSNFLECCAVVVFRFAHDLFGVVIIAAICSFASACECFAGVVIVLSDSLHGLALVWNSFLWRCSTHFSLLAIGRHFLLGHLFSCCSSCVLSMSKILEMPLPCQQMAESSGQSVSDVKVPTVFALLRAMHSAPGQACSHFLSPGSMIE